ncbi:MAG: hypothetical protein R2752_09545 [Vicinamibacterales bacterium]
MRPPLAIPILALLSVASAAPAVPASHPAGPPPQPVVLAPGPPAAGRPVRQDPARQDPVPPAPAQPDAYQFPSGAGMLFFYVRPDHAADFEAVLARLDAALSATTDPARARQAVSWRMFRSLESHDERIYVFFFDPAVPDASYDPVKALGDLLPDEVQDLYARLKAAIVRVERMGLSRIR